MNYVYINSEKGLWTVGFYSPDGRWQPESDHDIREEAAEKVHYLNGGNANLSSDNQSSNVPIITSMVKFLKLLFTKKTFK